MRIAIAGWYGSGNFGDEVLLSSAVTLIREILPAAEVVVLAANSERASRAHGLPSVDLSPPTRAQKFLDLGAMFRRLGDVDLLILGPGTIFQERSPNLAWPGTLPLMLRLALLARAAGTPVALLGSAVREGGTVFGAGALRSIGGLSSHMALRDEESAAYFGKGAEVVGDISAAWPIKMNRPAVRDSFIISGRPLRPPMEDRLADLLGAVSDSFMRRGLAGCFAAFSLGEGARGEDDRDFLSLLTRRRDLELLLPPLGPGEMVRSPTAWLEDLSSAQFMLATRLHAALIGLMTGMPVVAVSYESKVARTMAGLGLERFTVSVEASEADVLRTIDAAVASPEAFERARHQVLANSVRARQFVARMLSDVAN